MGVVAVRRGTCVAQEARSSAIRMRAGRWRVAAGAIPSDSFGDPLVVVIADEREAATVSADSENVVTAPASGVAGIAHVIHAVPVEIPSVALHRKGQVNPGVEREYRCSGIYDPARWPVNLNRPGARVDNDRRVVVVVRIPIPAT